jgi:hypothetical protein
MYADSEARERSISFSISKYCDATRPAVLPELQALLSAIQPSGLILPQSIAGKTIDYTLNRGWN